MFFYYYGEKLSWFSLVDLNSFRRKCDCSQHFSLSLAQEIWIYSNINLVIYLISVKNFITVKFLYEVIQFKWFFYSVLNLASVASLMTSLLL